MELSLETARRIQGAALAKAGELGLEPLVAAVLDARGCLKSFAAQDGTSLLRGEVAHGEAYGALAMGLGSRALSNRPISSAP